MLNIYDQQRNMNYQETKENYTTYNSLCVFKEGIHTIIQHELEVLLPCFLKNRTM